MSRAIWKGNFTEVESPKENVWSRKSVIPFSLVGLQVRVHSGKEFKRIYISREKVGFKFGSFVFTRIHNVKKKKVVKPVAKSSAKTTKTVKSKK
jgi:ribosomal protein S19